MLFNIAGQELEFRFVNMADAALIMRLRADAMAQGTLSQGAVNEVEQCDWLIRYLERHKQGKEFYFIIQRSSDPVGAVRIYNVDSSLSTFTWGSWVVKRGTEPSVAWLSAVAVYDYAFDTLGLSLAQFEVVARNSNVVKFHRSFGATVIRQSETLVEFQLPKEHYRMVREKFIKRIPGSAQA